MDQTLLQKAGGNSSASQRSQPEAHKIQSRRRPGWFSNMRKGAIPTSVVCISVSILCLSFPTLVVAAAAAVADSNTRHSTSHLISHRQAPILCPVNCTCPVNLTSCDILGDPDSYGLGIRIGLYLQWVASSIAYNFVPSEAITMRGVNTCFQAAMFSGLIWVTVKQNPTYAVEPFIMLLFCMGGVCSLTLHVSDDNGEQLSVPKRFALHEATTGGSFFRWFLGVAFCAYGLWYSYYGMDQMLQGNCGAYAFFLTKVNLYHWYRTFLKVSFTISAVPCAIMTIVGIFRAIVESISFCCGNWEKYRMEEGKEHTSDEGHTSLANFGFSVGMVVFIVAVELTIKWNHIQGVHSIGSTGQLLPLVIGILGVPRVLRGAMVRLIKSGGR